MGTPYKMKGSPIQRNFGTSPAKKTTGTDPVARGSLDFWNQTPEEHKARKVKDVAEHKASKTKTTKTTTPKKSINHVKRTTDKIHSTEKKIGQLKESRAKDIKKVKGNTVKISKKDVLKQMKKAGTKLPYSSVKNALKTSIKAAGKVAKFVPGVVGLVLGATKTATADQPKGGAKKKGSYTDDFTKLRK